MITSRRPWTSTLPALALLTLALGCSSQDPTEAPLAPTITVTGVEANQSYTTARTIEISIDRGSYEATLNGAAFTSGHTVNSPGSYVLLVNARNGSATSTREVRFSIVAGNRVLIIRMLDLGPNDAGGGGDAILLTDSSTAGQRHGLVDAGPAGVNGSDPAFVSRRLAGLRVDSLDFVILTHAHGDHYLGIPAIFSTSEVRRFVYNGQTRTLASYESLIALARSQADSVIVPAALRELRFGTDTTGPRLTVMPPLPTYLGDTDDGTRLNEGSLGARLVLGSFEMFFTGDGEVEATARWRTIYASLSTDVDVLKVGHHAANNAIFDNGFSGTSTWLDHTSPTVSIISANGGSHPRINALNRLLQQSNNRTYCTNVHGDIEIRVNQAGLFQVTVQRNAAAVCVPGTAANT